MFKTPSTFRQLVVLFGRTAPGSDARALFSQVDWTGVTKRQLVHVFLDRPPQGLAEAWQDEDFDPVEAACALFASDVFRNDLVMRLLRHFPGRKRLLFVHLPKSAGTDFQEAMSRVLPFVASTWLSTEQVESRELRHLLRGFARAVDKHDTIMVGGHVPLSWYLDEGAYRLHDRIVAILRDPHEISVSFANYVVHRFTSDGDALRVDTQGWANKLGLKAAEVRAIPPRDLALSLVTRPGFQTFNPICSLLGDGTAARTLDNLARADIELTSVAQYGAWLRKNFGLEREKRSNAAPRLIGWEDLSPWQQGQIEAGCSEDRIVYDLAMQCLDRAGTLSVTGPEVVAFAQPTIVHAP